MGGPLRKSSLVQGFEPGPVNQFSTKCLLSHYHSSTSFAFHGTWQCSYQSSPLQSTRMYLKETKKQDLMLRLQGYHKSRNCFEFKFMHSFFGRLGISRGAISLKSHVFKTPETTRNHLGGASVTALDTSRPISRQ